MRKGQCRAEGTESGALTVYTSRVGWTAVEGFARNKVRMALCVSKFLPRPSQPSDKEALGFCGKALVRIQF